MRRLELAVRREKIEQIVLGFTPEMGFCSASEAACAALFLLFVPRFRMAVGRTLQVGLGHDRFGNEYRADFRIGNAIIEYHPPRIWKQRARRGDFANCEDYRDYQRALRSVRDSERRFLKEAAREAATANYYRGRRDLLDQNDSLRQCELIVATGPEEIFWKVIRRFGDPGAIDEESCVELFELAKRRFKRRRAGRS